MLVEKESTVLEWVILEKVSDLETSMMYSVAF